MPDDTLSLHVYAQLPSGSILYAGRLLSRNLQSYAHKEGFFRYDEAYLAAPEAYAIDPVHLPLQAGTFTAQRGEAGVHGVFDDSLPDAWGRTILAKKAGLNSSRFTSGHLLAALAGTGLGSLLYSAQKLSTPSRRDGSIDFMKIQAALDEASLLEKNIDTANSELRHLLACGSSAGGARPKVLVKFESEQWLAKFASIKDIHPSLLVALEQAGMTLARLAGVPVPETRRLAAGDRDLLLVKRFDVTDRLGRNALVSMRTLTGQEDPYLASYADMAQVVRQVSVKPAADLESLFRWMLVNVLLQNSDDHLQNFSMLHTREGWRLSPGYDITPNIYQQNQILRINGKYEHLQGTDVLEEGRQFGLSSQKSKTLLAEVLQATGQWQQIFSRCAVPVEHSRALCDSIKQKRRLLGGS